MVCRLCKRKLTSTVAYISLLATAYCSVANRLSAATLTSENNVQHKIVEE